MSNNFSTQRRLLRDIYCGGEYSGPGFCCLPPSREVFEYPGGEFSLSQTPIGQIGEIMERQYIEDVRFHEAVGDDGVPLVSVMTGTQIYASAFGCEAHVMPDTMPCAKPLVFSAVEADAIKEPKVEDCRNLMRIFELIDEIKRRLGNEIDLGPPDMQTGFDTAALIWDKTSFLCAMLDPEERDAVKRLSEKCAQLFKNFVAMLRKSASTMSPCHCPGTWTPPSLGPWVSNDECGNMNTALFEEFCLPEMIELSETFGGLGMHCCATAEHQFESFKKIPNFYGFNRGENSNGYLPLLEHFGGPGSPVHVLGWISDEDTAELISRAPVGTRFIFNLMGEAEEAAKTWLEQMRALGH